MKYIGVASILLAVYCFINLPVFAGCGALFIGIAFGLACLMSN